MVLFLVTYAGGGRIFLTNMPQGISDPGLLPSPLDILVVSATHVLVVGWIIRNSRWTGVKLAAALSLAYYGTQTFMAQIETWYFLSEITVDPEMLSGLFLMGLFPSLIFIPVATLILGKEYGEPDDASYVEEMPVIQWFWKLGLIAVVYVVLYFMAGYFIAWQNPAVRAFYGGGDLGGFWQQMSNNLDFYPGLLPFQLLRGVLWALFVLPVIRMTKGPAWKTGLLVGMLIGVLFNIGHIMANPFIPDASVRLSHLVETASSNFVFGFILTWILHRRHDSVKDLWGVRSQGKTKTMLQVHDPGL